MRLWGGFLEHLPLHGLVQLVLVKEFGLLSLPEPVRVCPKNFDEGVQRARNLEW